MAFLQSQFPKLISQIVLYLNNHLPVTWLYEIILQLSQYEDITKSSVSAQFQQFKQVEVKVNGMFMVHSRSKAT